MTFDKEYFNIGYLDMLSYKDTFIHRLDPRIKVITTFIFIITVISFPKHEITALMPFLLFPALIFSIGDIPAKFILKKILLVSPFAVFIGIFNPFFDTDVMYYIYRIPVSGGWISFFSIIIKFILTISSALLLVATTSFPGVCYALQMLGVPEIFVSQTLFVYRYIFVLMEETMKIARARDMRSFGKKEKGIKTFTSLLGVLFVRTIEKSERIYQAMLSRGFDGRIRTVKPYRISAADFVFFAMSLTAFYFFWKYNVALMLGNLLIG